MQKQYVVTARAKGMHPLRALIKYPLRMALNFFVADIGSILPSIISGAEIVAIVLSLETTGPMLIKALQSQDMYLAGSFLMFLAFLNVIGVLVSDIALGFLDPRIRLQGRSTK
jgi:peptide/nickel transport system permease protein